MKDLFLTLFLVLIIMGLFVAAPVFGFVVGAGAGIWFLYYLVQDTREHSKKNDG